MPLEERDLVNGNHYFICQPACVLRASSDGKGAQNQLILGDWLKYKGKTHLHKWTTKGGTEKSQLYAYVRARGDNGWLKIEDFDEKRGLEVNFVDIGQGDGCHIVTPDDEVMLIDAGISDNMERFLAWRYNLRSRNVERAPDFVPRWEPDDPFTIPYVIMSHPDEDHYGGFTPVFENLKFQFEQVWHNGIVERSDKPSESGVSAPWDLGGQFEAEGEIYLFDYVASTTAMKKVLKDEGKTRKKLIPTFNRLVANSPDVKVEALGVEMGKLDTPVYLEGFEDNKEFSLQILGPIREKPTFKGKKRTALRKLGSEGETKNGHSVIFKATYNDLTLFLGGDLNSQSQNFLLQAYAGTALEPDKIEKDIKKLKAKRQPLKTKDAEKLATLEAEHAKIEAAGIANFRVDVAKACHHGSQHIIDSFIRSVNATATVISSGDNESHSHPRPDALGAYGKYGRGNRPLIFSTELARSTNEFTSAHDNYIALRGITLQIEGETDKKKKLKLLEELQSRRDRNVAVYGMITLRALGNKVIMAQKLEKVKRQDRKWDYYVLDYDETSKTYAYHGH